MSRGMFASIDSGAGFPANGLTVILVCHLNCHSPPGGTDPSSAKKKRTLFWMRFSGGRRPLLPGVDCLVPNQERGHDRPVFQPGDCCRRSIGGRTIVRQGDRVRTALKIVERGPVRISQGKRYVPVFGIVLRR